jgi:hypothetical protein
VFLLAGAECDKLVPAVGPSGSVTLVTDLPANSPAEMALRAALEREVVLVRPERAFRVESMQGGQLDRMRHARNLALMVDLSRTSDLTREVGRLVGERLLGEMRAGRRLYSLYSDVWANGQSVMVLAAPTAADLSRAIDANADRIYESLERRVIQQTAHIIYISGEQADFARYLSKRYGWTLRIPKGFQVSEDADEHVVRFLMSEGGTRLLFVHWQDGVDRLPSVEECIDIRARIVYFYDQDTVLREATTSQRTDFRGRRVLKLDGVWQNEKYTKGGPFRTYCLIENGRFYMIDLLVFDPRGGKIDLMRQVEAMAVTFRDERT